MTSPVSVLQQVHGLGVDIRPEGDKLQLRPPGKAPAELIQAIRQHKAEIIDILTRPRRNTLQTALAQKREEIGTMRRRLTSPYYAEDTDYLEWCRNQTACLQGHVDEIRRYLRDGGTLRLPPCCKDDNHICLIARRRFDACLMGPEECGFAISRH